MVSDSNSEESSSIRKVYVLPKELADRITEFQREKRLPSEVQAVRRLLDEALLHRDTQDSLLTRFSERLKIDAMPSSVARDLLVGHPLIEEVGFPSLDAVSFRMKGFGRYLIDSKGVAAIWDERSGNWANYEYYPDIPF